MKNKAFVIGRFQPFHVGHANLIKQAKSYGEEVVVLIGSANVARSIKNPLTFDERAKLITSEFPGVTVVPINDYPYDDRLWVSEIKRIIHDTKNSCIVGSNKDESTYYLKIFGDDIQVVDCPQYFDIDGKTVNATMVRDAIFDGKPVLSKWFASDKSRNMILDLFQTSAKHLFEEFTYIKRYKQSWSKSPFPPIFVTVDSVVVHRSSFLAVIRKGMPGKGLYAMPGGFIESHEFIKESALRELREETLFTVKNPASGAKLPMMEEWLKGSKVFDHPNRSTRGRTITHAFAWMIPDKYEIEVTAADDAAGVAWLPISMLMDPTNARLFMEDHFHLAKDCINLCK